MNSIWLAGVGIGVVVFAGCDSRSTPSQASSRAQLREPPPDPGALTSAKLPVSPASDSIRAAVQALGVRLPELRTVSRRGDVEIVGFEVHSDEALPTWEKLRALTGKSGYYPLIFRDEHGMLETLGSLGHDTPEDVLRAASALDVSKWLDSKRAEIGKYDPDHKIPRKPGARADPHDRLYVPYSHSGRPAPGVFVLLLPTRDGCEFPAILGWGGWNACPNPEVHVAIFRHWTKTCGAEPVSASGDVIELRVPAPIATQAEAIRLAEEQCLYCSDIVDQGVGSIDALAHVLANGRLWYFWWD